MRATSTIDNTTQYVLTGSGNTRMKSATRSIENPLKSIENASNDKTNHPQSILTAIIEIKQLISQTKDRDDLLESVCNYLTEKHGYYDAWIAVLDESQELVTTAEAKRPDSPPVCEYKVRTALAACLEYGGRSFGLISSSIPSDPSIMNKEQAMFKNIAHEVAHALHDMDIEEKARIVGAEMKAAQSQLVQSQKLATIGRLAASVAHEVNNNLTAILMASSFLLTKLEGANPNRPEIETIKGEALRTRSVVKNLLDFSRQSNGNVEVLDINEVIRNSVAVLRHHINLKSIKLIESYKDDAIAVAVDKNQMMQVFCNMINNALDATSRGGSITIGTKTAGKYTVIEISDTGTGISPETVKKIFEPFFTTKPNAKGTGLGLSISHNIVKQFGGDIEVESVPNEGTTFRILLPLAGAESMNQG